VGINRILALRGDEPRGEEYFVQVDSQFQHAIDLVRYIRSHHGDTFSIGVAGYPEGHDDALTLDREVHFLKEKVDAGADFVVTQLFYDVEGFLKWYRSCRAAGASGHARQYLVSLITAAGITVPVLPGIMPIQNYQSFRRMTGLCKSLVPDEVNDALAPIAHDDTLVKDFGVRFAQETIRRLRTAEPSITGFNLCTLNLEKSVRRILDGLDWVPHCASMYGPSEGADGTALPSKVTPHLNGASEAPPATHAGQLAPRLDAPATWDDFPNGRFGDARSPAYGDLDGWGVSLKLTPAEALQHWGRPTSAADIGAVFAAYIRGAIPAIAWSDEPLRLESSVILHDLTRLNVDRGWWTVGSQPAVDGAPSDDRAHGFGPKGGYVYQKAFVEFFCPRDEVDALARRAEETNRAADGRRVTYFAGGSEPASFRTNMAPGEVNAVTWGVFPGQDLVTTTLIEELSFKAWKVRSAGASPSQSHPTRVDRKRPFRSGTSGSDSTRRRRRAESSSRASSRTAGLCRSCTTTTKTVAGSGASSGWIRNDGSEGAHDVQCCCMSSPSSLGLVLGRLALVLLVSTRIAGTRGVGRVHVLDISVEILRAW
jgi:methylenetetrahydrofolate reductase (NADPH)